MTSATSHKIVQSLWYGRPLGIIEQVSIQSFIDHGYDFHLYTYSDIAGVPASVTLCDANAIMPKARCDELLQYSKTLPSNLFRCLLLYQKGGWWIDCDVICLRDLPCNQDYVVGLQTPTEINNGIIFAPKAAPFLKNAIKAFESSFKPRRWDSYPILKNKFMRYQAWLRGKRNFPPFFHAETGPKLITNLFKFHHLSAYALPETAFYPIHWDNWQTIFNGEASLSQLSDSYCLHLWNNMFHENPKLVEHPTKNSLFNAFAQKHPSQVL